MHIANELRIIYDPIAIDVFFAVFILIRISMCVMFFYVLIPRRGKWEVKHNKQRAVWKDNWRDTILSSRRKNFIKFCNAICADTLWIKNDDINIE